MLHHRSLGWILGCGLAFACAAAQADVTTESTLAIDGVGIMSVVGLTGRLVKTVSGNRMRDESQIKFNSKVLSFLARRATGPHVDIVRLDQDKIYEIDVNKQQYSETSFAQRRAMLEAASAKASEQSASERQQQPTAFDDSQCDWSPPRTEVKKGAKATIAGFEAQQLTITSTQTCTDRKTKQSCDLALIVDSWLAQNVPGIDEQLKFDRAYAEKLGLGPVGSREVMERAKPLFARYQGSWKDVSGKLKDVKGSPLRTSFGMAIGGPNCKSASDQQQAGGGLPPSSPSAGEIGGQVASSAVQEKTGGALGGVAGAIGGKLAGAFFNRKKKDDDDGAATQNTAGAAPPAAAGGMIDLVRISMQITAINTNPAPADLFEPPPGFKKLAGKD
ncbi:MAG TPA: hypothetical protein VF315_07625 [Steroidobacteraceae bacterium]